MNIKSLMNQMTIEEKIGQLLQIAPFFFIKELDIEVSGHVNTLSMTHQKIFSSGSVLGIGNAEEMIQVQTKYLQENRHKIPLMFMADIIHGYETIFPVPLALSCSWNPGLVKNVARISALEAQTSGIHVTFSPMVDLVRDPRWGRVVESFGEDPYLHEVYAKAMVEGYQNEDIKKVGHIASCVKHFAAYGLSEAGRDYNTVDLSRVSLHNQFLPGYKAAIDAGARLIMTAFNVLDGIPSTVNQYLLRDVLRKTWKFQGVTISDYDSLHQVIAHGCAKDDYEAAYRGISAGLDIEMASLCYVNHLKTIISEGKISCDLLDEAVERVLTLKNDLGLFENPFKGADPNLAKALVRSEKHLDFSRKVAHESMVLLKNDGILPLKQQKVALLGLYATSRETNGPWSWHGKNDLNASLEEALIAAGIQVCYVQRQEDPNQIPKEDYPMIESADVIVIAIGEHTKQSGEAHSRSILEIPFEQDKLIHDAQRFNKPIVTLLYNGRPLILESIQSSNAILETWFSGSMGNHAIADLLNGNINPSGKLTMSFPRNVGQIPIYYNHLNTGRPQVLGVQNEYVSYYLDVSNQPLYPFGYGLSYSNFKYQSIQLSKNQMTKNETLSLEVQITNDSDRGGYEVVQLYLRDVVAYISRPVMELKGFKKIWFSPHETKVVSFDIHHDMLSYRNEYGEDVFEYGTFKAMVGSDSLHVLSTDFDFVKE